MKPPKENTAVVAREAKRRLENPLTKAQNLEKIIIEAERQQTI
jgi:hypothetical protein